MLAYLGLMSELAHLRDVTLLDEEAAAAASQALGELCFKGEVAST